MKVVYAAQEFPPAWEKSIFLAGGTPRSEQTLVSWRHEALAILQQEGFDGVVFVPEDETGRYDHSYDHQVEWEKQALNFADVILFWVPRDMQNLPCLTTNVEFGKWVSSGKCVLGFPPDAPGTRYLQWLLVEESGSAAIVCSSLQETVVESLSRFRPYASDSLARIDGERSVPMNIWVSPMFQQWYQNQVRVGNILQSAKVLWQFVVSKNRKLFSFVLHVEMWVRSEQRLKSNEFVFSRTDISSVVLWHRAPEVPFSETEVVLVKEFRSPARTRDGFIHELPGGSTVADKKPEEVALEEVVEETGLSLDASRLRYVGSRQLAGTLSSHHSHLYSVELSALELLSLKRQAFLKTTFGVDADSERTYLEVVTLGSLLKNADSDWSCVGMVMTALNS